MTRHKSAGAKALEEWHRAERKRSGLTTTALAAKLRITRAHYHGLLRGISGPSLDLATRILLATGGHVRPEDWRR